MGLFGQIETYCEYNVDMKTYTLAGGCFWCLDGVYGQIKGVESVVSGYSGGKIVEPSYEQVSTGTTGHAEVVQITFDEKIIPKDVILDIFFLIHDPTTKDRQGNDIGPQYRSVMFYADDNQQQEFMDAVTRAKKHWSDQIVTEIVALDSFYPAGKEHQDYYANNPEAGYCQIVISPKIIKARSKYGEWFK